MKQLSISTNMWSDPYFVSLDCKEKLLWMYFLSNPVINIAGIMREGVKSLSMQCAIEDYEVEFIMEKFVADKKVLYQDNFIFVINWMEYHCYNPSVLVGAKACIADVPEWFRTEIEVTLGGVDTILTPSPGGVDTHVNSNSNNINNNTLNTKSNSDSKPEKAFDWELIKETWNKIATEFDNIKAVNKITTTRKAKIKTRSEEGFDLIEKQPEVLEAITNSDFLQGKSGGRKWSITFGFLFHNDTNWVKIIEGGYGGNSNKNAKF